MHDSMSVGIVKRLQDASDDADGLLDVQSVDGPILEHLVERGALDQLHHDADDATLGEHVGDGDDVGVLQPLVSPGLVPDSDPEFRVCDQIVGHRLDRHELILPGVEGTPHTAHPSLGNEIFDDVVPKPRTALYAHDRAPDRAQVPRRGATLSSNISSRERSSIPELDGNQ
jgi:hypothetical protein